MEEIKTKIKNFLERFFRKQELKDEDDMFSLGVVNSLFAMQLVTFLEKEFKIKITNKDLNPDNFRTIQNIAIFVEGKLTA